MEVLQSTKVLLKYFYDSKKGVIRTKSHRATSWDRRGRIYYLRTGTIVKEIILKAEVYTQRLDYLVVLLKLYPYLLDLPFKEQFFQPV